MKDIEPSDFKMFALGQVSEYLDFESQITKSDLVPWLALLQNVDENTAQTLFWPGLRDAHRSSCHLRNTCTFFLDQQAWVVISLEVCWGVDNKCLGRVVLVLFMC